MNIFRSATKQAIREIVENHGSKGKFGFILTDENIDSISDKVVDLFEIALSLRNKSQNILYPQHIPEENTQTKPSSLQSKPKPTYREPLVSEKGAFPRTKNAAEIYDFPKNYLESARNNIGLPPTIDFKLPRRRISLSESERSKLEKD
ncbi:MAG: hypothetical protein K2X39_08915 [Silvanigrellaceae bacterium]|nr:hypothetical protein [Silvanigrellaceae bacterium]